MAQTEERKKYWKDQIKSMVGPCMITFAIPLTVPGLTITFVAYSDDTSFPRYSAMHITGLLLLILAVFLIILGCFLRYFWKPFLNPDLERHLSPTPSMLSHSSHSRKNRMDRIFKKDRSSKQSRESPNTSSDPFTKIQNERQMSLTQTNDATRSQVTQECETESNTPLPEVEDTRMSSSVLDTQMPMTPRRGHLPPISPRPLCSNSNDQIQPIDESISYPPSLNDIQVWRKKKRKRRKRKQKPEEEGDEVEEKTDNGVVNKASDCEENKIHYNDSETNNEMVIARDDLDVSGGSIRSSNHSLLNEENEPQEKKKKKKRKKRTTLSSLKMDSSEKSPEKHKKEHLTQSDEAISQTLPLRMSTGKSDESDASVGSIDSVLAQYTSRSENANQKV